MRAPVDCEEGPLWDSIKRQLYRPEVSHVKRLVGDALIQQNKVMWDELVSLRQIIADFEAQNYELTERGKKQVHFSTTQHRDLLTRQAQMLMEDIQMQASACGYVLDDMVPELKCQHLRDFFTQAKSPAAAGSSSPASKSSPPRSPSTRSPSSSGWSTCSSTPTPDMGLNSLCLGRQLGLEELDAVAAGIREALEAESEALLAAVGEQTQRFEAEAARVALAVAARSPSRGPTTAELQQLVHKLQSVALSPGLRALAVAGPPCPSTGANLDPFDGAPLLARPVTGAAHVRRLKALIALQRDKVEGLRFEPTAGSHSAARAHCGGVASAKAAFDPFFDDPFA